MTTEPGTPRPVDPLLAARLDRLAQRRTPAGGAPLPPPSAGSAPSSTAAASASTRTRRRHPARAARIGALAMSCATTGGLIYMFAGANASQAASDALAALPAPIATSSSATTATTTATPTTSAGSSTTTAASSTGAGTTDTSVDTTATTVPAADTTAASTTTASSALVAFDGSVVDTKFGPVQVQVQVRNGQIIEVAVVQYPAGDHKSVQINARALPTLRTEVLSAQSAEVDTVSGATYTSNGYRQSLQSAIDEARAAGALA